MNLYIYNEIIFTCLLISVLISIALFFKSKSNIISNKFLSFHLFLTAIFVLEIYFNILDIFFIYPHLFRLFTPLQYLIIPALYLHLRLLLFPKKKLSYIDLVWILPFVIQIIDLTPFYLSTKQEKIEILNQFAQEKLNFQPQGEGFLLPNYFNSLFKIFLVFICDILIAKNIVEFYQLKSKDKILKTKFVWAIILFIISLIFQTLPYILILFLDLPFQIIFTYSMAIGILTMSIYLIFTPGLLYHENHLKIEDNQVYEHTINKLDDINIDDNDNDKFDIDKETCENYKKIIIEVMVHKEYYKSNDCSLSKISEATNIPAHHISIVMKKCVNKRFNDFVNELRIDDIIKEIENDNNSLTIEGLSNNYGFNSKSTFYRAFKKYKGCTPKEFFKNIT